MELLCCRGITKFFPSTGILADDRVDLSLAEGEIRAVVGENGAGKSSLAKIISGILSPDSGEVLVRGRRIEPGSVRAAEAAGIGYVPQVSLLAEGLTIAENLILGREPREAGLFVSKRKAYVEAALLLERVGLRVDPEARVSTIGASERREVEIARALARGGSILILDEPTSILSEPESERIFELLRRLAREGKSIILITHRLGEVRKVADTITVLRRGSVIADERVSETSEGELSSLMARMPAGGLESRVPGRAKADTKEAKEAALELRGLVLGPGAAPVDIAVAEGEVLAVAALAGNGLGALEDYASGMKKPKRGQVLVQGRKIESYERGEMRSSILAYVPSDREKRGLCLPLSMRDNILALRRGEFKALDWLGSSKRNIAAEKASSLFELESGSGQAADSLSGGNRQRLLLCRELDEPRAVLVLAEPFQGLDLAAQARAEARIRELAERGSAVLLLVSNAEDCVDVADRVVALYRGEIAYEGSNEGSPTAAALFAAMTGRSGSAA